MLKPLLQLVVPLLHQACPQSLVVVAGQSLVDRQGLCMRWGDHRCCRASLIQQR